MVKFVSERKSRRERYIRVEREIGKKEREREEIREGEREKERESEKQ